MEWYVIDFICLKSPGCYVLALKSGELKMLAKVLSCSPVYSGDSLYPVKDAIYLVNRDKNRRLKVLKASGFCMAQWEKLKRQHTILSNKGCAGQRSG